MATNDAQRPIRVGIVLSGGGARGAYEAGVLSYLFEHVYPKLPPGFEFEVVSGTSVGAIHAGYIAASAGQPAERRASELMSTWSGMALGDVLKLSAGDVFGVPLRALGIEALMRGGREGGEAELIGGLVDVSPLERIVEERIPWSGLRSNMRDGSPRVLCVSCTNVDTGLVTVFVDGEEIDARAWDGDRYAQAIHTEIDARHVRASAAIPFLFPAVRIGGDYYLDGGLRVNTPLSPALRLGADKVLVLVLKCEPIAERVAPHAERAITHPAFLLGKMLNVLILDQLEHELRRVETINTMLEAAGEAMGSACIESINQAMREKRGLEYRRVDTVVVRPSADLGAIAAESYHRNSGGTFSRGVMSRMLARLALHGVPDQEADLFSYLYFDASYTRPLLEIGREDAKRQEDEILALLS